MHTFLSQHICLQEFVAALAMLVSGLEGLPAEQDMQLFQEKTIPPI
ncbi:MAG: hypothetical protein Q7T38_07380 [Gallionella sp.]|nr:hypothetical protein [Gallionella sp.]